MATAPPRTDGVPLHSRAELCSYLASEKATEIALPPSRGLRTVTKKFLAAVEDENAAEIERTSKAIVAKVADYYSVSTPHVTVLDKPRPRRIKCNVAGELFGD